MRLAEAWLPPGAGGRARVVVRIALATVALAATGLAFYDLVRFHPIGVDLDIPLRAAERWAHGETPYLASSFTVVAGRDLPFLYPPFTLPLFAALLVVPRTILIVAWLSVGLVVAGAACRRLGIPALWLPLVLMWPPFSEALIGGNLQVWLFLAFAYLYWSAPSGPFGLRHRAAGEVPGPRGGFLAALIGVLKVTQLHAWVDVLGRAPRAALLGLTPIGLAVMLTLPLVGIDPWREWFEQLARAADPAWVSAGIGFNRVLPPAAMAILAVASVGAVLFVPRAVAGYWIGILIVGGGASLRIFSVLFMLPAILRLRPEPALIAITLISLYGGQPAALWLGILLVPISFVLWQKSGETDDQHLRDKQVARPVA